MAKVLITGASGFLGRTLAGHLGDQGMDVHALVRPGSDLGPLYDLPIPPMVHVHDGKTGSLIQLLGDIAPCGVFHLAGLYRGGHETRPLEPLICDNLIFGTQVLEACVRTGVQNFVNTGSYAQFMDGGMQARPLNLSVAIKEAFETMLAYYQDAFPLNALTLVLFDTYGPGDGRGKLLETIINAQESGKTIALSAKDMTLHLVYKDDVAKAFAQAYALIETDPSQVRGKRFAVTSKERVQISRVVSLIEEIGDKPVIREWGKYPPSERSVLVPWDGPILPGWSPRVGLKEGIRRMIEGRG